MALVLYVWLWPWVCRARGIEIGLVVSEAELALRHVKEWMAPVKVSTPLVQLPASSYVKRDPFGTCLIISPWNYPGACGAHCHEHHATSSHTACALSPRL